jgi:hypothetical protein
MGCAIAQYLAEKVIHDSLQQAIDDINAHRQLVDFGAALVGSITAETLLGPFIATAASGLFTAATAGDLTHYQDAVEDPLLLQRIRCALQTAIGTDGGVTIGNFAAVTAAIAGVSYAHAEVVTAIGDFVSNLGAQGLITAQSLGGLEAGDCAPCSTWCKVWDFKISQYGWAAVSGGWGGAGVGYQSLVVDGHDQCTVIGIGGDGSQVLDTVRVKGFNDGVSTAPSDGTRGRMVRTSTGTVLGLLPNIAGAFDVTIDCGGRPMPDILVISNCTEVAVMDGINTITYVAASGTGTAPGDGVAC